MNLEIIHSIQKSSILEFHYINSIGEITHRYVAPYRYGLSNKDEEIIRGVLLNEDGSVSDLQNSSVRIFKVKSMVHLKLLDRTFSHALAESQKVGDKHFKEIFTEI